MTVKIAHLADTHLGYRQYGLIEREKDFYESFEKIIDDIIDKEVDYVIHSGDLFEQGKPPINALLCAQKGFVKLMENKIPVIVIAGNHDFIQKKDTSIPQKLYENENFHILTIHDRYIKINEDIIVAGLPYIQKSHEKAVKKMLNEIVKSVKSYKHKILMLHGGTTKHFEFNPEFELDTIPKGFDYYAMGHIHKRILENDFKGGILSYPGSTEIKDKGEIEEYEKNHKGYNLLSISENISVEFIDIKLERKFLVEDIRYPELDQKLNELESRINNEILSYTDKKPVLILTVKEGDFNSSDVAQRVYDKLGDISLTIRLNYNPTLTKPGTDGQDKPALSPEMLIREQLSEYNNEYISQLGVDLYEALIEKNTEQAEEISQSFYDKYYKNNNGEEKC